MDCSTVFTLKLINCFLKKHFGLPYIEALTKAFEVVKRDAEHVTILGNEFNTKNQVESLLSHYLMLDPDNAYKKIHSLESNEKILKDEIHFLIEMFLVQKQKLHNNPQRDFNFVNRIRIEHLKRKYLLSESHLEAFNLYTLLPIMSSFPEKEYNIKRDNPRLCSPLPDAIKKYKNFKREYNIVCIFSMLPSGEKYGGFVKAILHLELVTEFKELISGHVNFHIILGTFRTYYNSSYYGNEKRVEFFEKLDIKEDDLKLWSQLFDKQYPGFKDVHKFFGQVA